MTLIDETLGGHYRLVRLLGRGGMSDVYEALDTRSGLTVAVKILRSSDPEFVRRLAHEARALESFEHPGLVRLYETGLAGDQTYLVMEYVEGITLAESLRRSPLATRDTAALGVSLGDALDYVHERGVVHRDVKPSNILISTNGEVKLGDFGIAQLHDAATLTIAGTMLGTVSYMAPEQLEGTQVGPSADIWSLGIVLLECLTGQRVYEGSPSEIVARRLREPIPLPSDLPVAWKILFSGMLDHRPDQRLTGREVTALLATSPYSALWAPNAANHDDATYDLTALAPGADVTMVGGPAAFTGADATRVSAPPTTTVPRHHPARRSAKTAIGALVALAVIGIGLGFWLVPSTPRDPKRTTTTTTMPSASTALSSLVSDMARAQSAGRMGPGAEQSIASSAEQALANNTAGNITQAGNDLQKAETTIVNGIQGGTIAEAEGIQLLHALSVLSNSLGVAIPPTTTTTTTTSTTTTTTSTTTTTQPFPGGPGGPGNGNGNGNGN
jgi:eukaryotic-like serine/threonine-protein kinase